MCERSALARGEGRDGETHAPATCPPLLSEEAGDFKFARAQKLRDATQGGRLAGTRARLYKQPGCQTASA